MKVTYLGFKRFISQKPEQATFFKTKIIPGDHVEIPKKIVDGFKFLEDEIVDKNEGSSKSKEEEKPEVCEKCLKIKKRCVCSKREAEKKTREAMTKTEEEKEKKVEIVIEADVNKAEKIMEKKSELKKSGKSKLDQKKELKEFQEELKKAEVKEVPKEEPKKETKPKKKSKGKLRKDPKTGEFFTEKE